MSSAVILIGSRLVMSSMGGSLGSFADYTAFPRRGAACTPSPRLLGEGRDEGALPPGSEWWERPLTRIASPSGMRARNLRQRHVADVLRHLVALLHRRTLGDRNVPALDVG